MMKHIVIIVAGGSGSRFGGDVPKQFRELAGEPVLMHTLRAFEGALAGVDHELVIALPEAHIDWWFDLCRQHNLNITHSVTAGGNSRFQSVKNALDSLGDICPDDLIAVHDGVRPLVSRRLINEAFATAAQVGAVVPAVPVTDSVRMLDAGGTSHALRRSTLRAVQTPQVFRAALLVEAYEAPFSPLFTDDASVVERAGNAIALVEGDASNIKITRPADLAVAELMLKESSVI